MEKTPETINSDILTRWNGVSVLLKSVVAKRNIIGSVLTSKKTCRAEDRPLDVTEISKASTEMEFSANRSYWSALEKPTPFFHFMNVTYLKSDTVPLSSVGLSFVLLYQACARFLPSDSVVIIARQKLKQQITTTVSYINALVVLLDAAVGKVRWADVCLVYDKPESFPQGARRALSKTCQLLGFDNETGAEANGCFQMAIADKDTVFKRGYVQETTYHPQLLWSIDGSTASPLLGCVGTAVFSLFEHSAGNERGFKVRSRNHNKERN